MTYEIETERLFLRAPCMDDAPAIAEGLNNFNVTRFLSKVPFPYAEADAQDWISRLADFPATYRAFAIRRKDADLLGVVSLESELGYWLAEPHWGKGYATEAAAAAVNWYFEATDADSIASGAHFDNPASLNVQRKLGFDVTGREMQFALSRGEDIEHVKTRLTRTAFERVGGLS